jgi:hypothetical protein
MNDAEAFVLNQTDRLALMGLTTHPGFRVLTAMMETACRTAAAKVVQCDPTEDKKVMSLLSEARAANAFSDLLRRAINWNVQCAKVTEKSQAA